MSLLDDPLLDRLDAARARVRYLEGVLASLRRGFRHGQNVAELLDAFDRGHVAVQPDMVQADSIRLDRRWPHIRKVVGDDRVADAVASALWTGAIPP